MRKQKGRQTMAKQDDTPQEGSAEQATDASVAVLRPFLDARNAYFNQLNEGWQAAQRGLKDVCGAHTKTHESLANELKQGITDAAGRYEEGLRAASRALPEDLRHSTVSAFSRYQSEVSLAQIAAAQKWIAHKQELDNTILRLQQSHAERCRDAYQNYLDALKQAWQSVDIKQLPAGQLGSIVRFTDEIARHAWCTTGSL